MPKHVTITLLSRPGCHLCDDARLVIGRVRSSLSSSVVTSFEELNILEDTALARRHSEDIPVVLVNGRQHAVWRVDEARLEAAIEKAARAPFFSRGRTP